MIQERERLLEFRFANLPPRLDQIGRVLDDLPLGVPPLSPDCPIPKEVGAKRRITG